MAFVYPIPLFWISNSNGWLNKMDFRDFSGSGGIHLIGGMFGLALAFLCKPRHGRFPTFGWATWSVRTTIRKGKIQRGLNFFFHMDAPRPKLTILSLPLRPVFIQVF